MFGTPVIFTLFCMAVVCVAFDFDLLSERPLSPRFALFASNDMGEPILSRVEESDDNAGFEKPAIFAGRSSFNTRRLLQEPPLKKRSVEHRLIREPPLKRSMSPIDLVYRFPYSIHKTSRLGPVVIQPVDF